MVSLGHEATVSYSQKVEEKDLTKINKNELKPILFSRSLDQFSREQIIHICTELEDYFKYFGYADVAKEAKDLYTVTEEDL